MLIDGLSQPFPVTRRANLGPVVILPGQHLQHIESIDAELRSGRRALGMISPASRAVPAACMCRYSPDDAAWAGPSCFFESACCIKGYLSILKIHDLP